MSWINFGLDLVQIGVASNFVVQPSLNLCWVGLWVMTHFDTSSIV